MHKPINIRNKIPSEYVDVLELVQLLDRRFRDKIVEPFQGQLHHVFYRDMYKVISHMVRKDLDEANKYTQKS